MTVRHGPQGDRKGRSLDKSGTYYIYIDLMRDKGQFLHAGTSIGDNASKRHAYPAG
jgi:hypothetical protein